MKVAEVEINTKLTVKVNDAELKAFKTKCAENGTEMSVVLRRFMRRYVKR